MRHLGFVIVTLFIGIFSYVIGLFLQKEHFEGLKEIYYQTALERNPLTLYLDKSDAYINLPYIKNIFDSYVPGDNIKSPIKIKPTPIEKLIGKKFEKKIPIAFTTKSKNSDLILIPEFNAKDRLNRYKYLSKMTELKFAYLYIDSPITNMNNFFDIENKNICMKNGYTKDVYNELYKNLNVFPKKITYYDDENDIVKLLKNGTCDAVAILMIHPNAYLKKISQEMALKVIGWDEQRFDDNIKKQMLISSKATLPLKFYNFVNFNKSLRTHSIDLNLYVKSSLDDEIVFDLTEIIYRPNGILRSYALSTTGAEFIEIHSGTRKWLMKNGLLALGSVSKPVPESCTLLAGVSECNETAANFAEKTYQDMRFFNNELGDLEDDDTNGLDAIPYLRHAEKRKDHQEFGHVYQQVLTDHGKYLT